MWTYGTAYKGCSIHKGRAGGSEPGGHQAYSAMKSDDDLFEEGAIKAAAAALAALETASSSTANADHRRSLTYDPRPSWWAAFLARKSRAGAAVLTKPVIMTSRSSSIQLLGV